LAEFVIKLIINYASPNPVVVPRGEGLNGGKVLNLIFESYTKGKVVDPLLFE